MNLVTETATTYGIDQMTDAQLMGLLLHPRHQEQAESMLQRAGSLGHLLQFGPAELREFGLTRQEMFRLSVLPELWRRTLRNPIDPPRLNSPKQAGAYLLPRCSGLGEEHFGLLALNTKCTLLADRILSKGTATATLISPREFFREALKYGATSVIAWHNHPSGDPVPSPEDIHLTRRLQSCGDSLGVPLVDHLIVGRQVWHSFRAAEGWDGENTAPQ